MPQLLGLYVRVTATNRLFYVAARNLNKKQVWQRIGDRTTMSVAEAVEKAPLFLKAIKEGNADVADAGDGPPTFKKIARRMVRGQGRERGPHAALRQATFAAISTTISSLPGALASSR